MMTKYIRITAMSLLTLSCAALTSCSETDAEKDRGSVPQIMYARPCDAAKGDSLIVSASLGAKLAFVGNNLGDVQQVWFNDQKAKLNPTMVTSHTIIVDVPNVIPSEVSDKVRFITSTGVETEMPFVVTVPAPRIESMDCEYAKPGTQTVLHGAYFADDPSSPLKVVFEGSGEEATIVAFDQDNITVVVPDGAVEGPINVKTIYGEGTTSFHYADTRGMMFDFEPDGITGLGMAGHWWKAPTFVSDELSLTGNYLKLGNDETTVDKNAWPETTHLFTYWAGDWGTPLGYPAREGERLCDVVDFTRYKDMTLKFEMLVPSSNPWQQLALQLIFAGVDKVCYGPTGTDIAGRPTHESNNSYYQDDNGKSDTSWGRALYRPWSATKAFDTADKWITVSVPLDEFIYNSVGGKAKKVPSSPDDFANFEIFLWAGGVEGVDCKPIICIDNIRAVRK